MKIGPKEQIGILIVAIGVIGALWFGREKIKTSVCGLHNFSFCQAASGLVEPQITPINPEATKFQTRCPKPCNPGRDLCNDQPGGFYEGGANYQPCE